IATGFFIKPRDWNARAHLVKSTSLNFKEINQNLQSLQSRALQLHNQLTLEGKPFSPLVFKNRLTGRDQNRITLMSAIAYHNELVKKGIGKNYAQKTYDSYYFFADKIKAFLNFRYRQTDLLLSELNHKFLTEFEHYLYEVLHNQVNTALKNIVQLRKIINMCVDLEWIEKFPFKRLKSKQHTPKRDYLTMDELHTLENIHLTNKRLQTVRDLFLFQCYTGLAFIDLKQLTSFHIAKGVDNGNWIIIRRQKTRTRSTLPLLTKAEELIEKYNSMNGTTVFPAYSNQKLNKYLKELASMCKFNKRITTHAGRRTFATTITLSNGVPIETVSRMLGHSDLKTTAIYAKVVDTKISEDMKRLKDKI
ncbi:MAG: site-specific integrase, partial [Bacteroidota bacterium]